MDKSIQFCPQCKSSHTIRFGYNTTKAGKKLRMKCQQCGTTFYAKEIGGKVS